jgi:lysozyme family protein
MLLEHEGGFVNHPKDPGGMTNLGVTRATYEQFLGRAVTEAEMRALTPKDVGPLYKSEYWDKARCDDLPSGLDWGRI